MGRGFHGYYFVTATWEKITKALLQEEASNASTQSAVMKQYNTKYWNGILELAVLQRMPIQEKISFMQEHQIAVDWPRLCCSAMKMHFEGALDLVLTNYHFIPSTIKVGNCTMLFLAMILSEAYILKFIRANANAVNVACNKGMVPLMVTDKVPVAQLLIDMGANVNAVSHHGKSVLCEHLRCRRYDIVHLLLKNGAKATTACAFDANWYEDTSKYNQLFDTLVANFTHGQWKSVLKWAIQHNCTRLISESLKRGAHITELQVLKLLPSGNWCAALKFWKFDNQFLHEHFALTCKNYSLRKQANISLTDRDKHGNSALSFAVKARKDDNDWKVEYEQEPRFFSMLQLCGYDGALVLVKLRADIYQTLAHPLVFRINKIDKKIKPRSWSLQYLLILSAQRKPYMLVYYPENMKKEDTLTYVSTQLKCPLQECKTKYSIVPCDKCFMLQPRISIPQQMFDVRFEFKLKINLH